MTDTTPGPTEEPQGLVADTETPQGHEYIAHQDGQTDQDDADLGHA